MRLILLYISRNDSSDSFRFIFICEGQKGTAAANKGSQFSIELYSPTAVPGLKDFIKIPHEAHLVCPPVGSTFSRYPNR